MGRTSMLRFLALESTSICAVPSSRSLGSLRASQKSVIAATAATTHCKSSLQSASRATIQSCRATHGARPSTSGSLARTQTSIIRGEITDRRCLTERAFSPLDIPCSCHLDVGNIGVPMRVKPWILCSEDGNGLVLHLLKAVFHFLHQSATQV